MAGRLVLRPYPDVHSADDALKEPVMPSILNEANEAKIKNRIKAKAAKFGPGLEPNNERTPVDDASTLQKSGRSRITFVDVGGKFIDTKAEAKRIAASERRKRVKAKRRERVVC